MRNQGKIFAFERDRKRYGTLEAMLARAGCANVEALNLDFLTTDVMDKKYCRVTHILLDPSCSGSGIVNRLDHLVESEAESSSDARTERLAKLAAFQLQMIRHAMKFPAIEKIVYSTCSVHPEENEQVVSAALRSTEATAGGFRLAPRSAVLPAWSRRGRPGILSDTDTEAVVRCSPGEDLTNGFFVSCFIRSFGGHSGMRGAEAAVAGNDNVPGAQSVTTSAKRKIHNEDSGDSTALPSRSKRRQKRKKE